jgi:16S rRNA (guanine527-N7)-methyltransferase
VTAPNAEVLVHTLHEASLQHFASSERMKRLSDFIVSMLEINETLNLTRLTSEEEVSIKHVLDSAVAFPLLEKLGESTPAPQVMDLGSGCGFPGAAIAAVFPAWKVTLMDATAKKVQALGQCVQNAGLSVEVLKGRAEELGQDPPQREAWDIVTARAVADLPVLLEYALPFLKVGGHLVAWLSQDQMRLVDKSKNALDILQGKITEQQEYRLPGIEHPRWLLVVEKMGKTPEKYPRLPGFPSKHPL